MQRMQKVKFPNSSLIIILSRTKLRMHGQTYKETNTNTINLVA